MVARVWSVTRFLRLVGDALVWATAPLCCRCAPFFFLLLSPSVSRFCVCCLPLCRSVACLVSFCSLFGLCRVLMCLRPSDTDLSAYFLAFRVLPCLFFDTAGIGHKELRSLCFPPRSPMDGPLAWLDVVPEVGLRLFVFLSPRDEGRLATVDLLHYQLRRLQVHIPSSLIVAGSARLILTIMCTFWGSRCEPAQLTRLLSAFSFPDVVFRSVRSSMLAP